MYVRSCPKCDVELHYTNKYNYIRACRFNRTCMSCRSKGKTQRPAWIRKRIPKGKHHYMYGKTYTKRKSRLMGDAIEKSWNDIPIRQLRLNGMAKSFGFSSYDEYKSSLPKFRKFKLDVKRLTNHQPIHTLENFNKRGPAGNVGAYHLDHVVSIYAGFIQGMLPEQIATIDNLRMIPWEENLKKGRKCIG